MQMSLHFSKAVARCGATLVAAALFGMAFVANLSADPYASPWITGKKSAARLIVAAQAPVEGVFRAGVEVRLDAGSHTYWRTPGDAGAAPVFVFDSSENIAGVKVLYPIPTRIDEAGLDAFGYSGEVTFPLLVTVKDAARPALLALRLQYAVCGKICLPVTADIQLPLSTRPDEGASIPQQTSITAAETRVPLRLTPAERDAKVAVKRDEQAEKPTWRMSLREDAHVAGEPESAKLDLFAEAPEGWYFETKKGDRPNEFLIVEVERPKLDSAGAVPVTLTLAQPGQSYEFAIDLEADSRTPLASPPPTAKTE
ncbi:MAG: protein-disulfide reductase DsbD domain-containing protein [Methylocella sp.]